MYHASAHYLDFKGLFHGLNMANNYGVNNVEIRGSNDAAIAFISGFLNQGGGQSSVTRPGTSGIGSGGVKGQSPAGELHEPIRKALARFAEYRVEQVPEDKNVYCAKLAKRAIQRFRQRLDTTGGGGASRN